MLQADPRQPDALHLLGLLAHDAGQFAAAIELIGQAIASDAHMPAYYNNLGLAHHAAGDNANAIDSFAEALRLKPDYAEAHNNLGALLRAAGRLDEAAAHFQEALRLQPDFAEAHNNVGQWFQQQGKLPEALAHFRRAVELRPHLAEAHYNLASLCHQERHDTEALVHLQTCLRLRPSYGPAQALMARLPTARGVASVGARDIGWSVPSAEESFRSGSLLLGQGRLDEAVIQLQRGLEMNPRSAQAYNCLGSALQELGRLGEAIAAYQHAAALRPDDADVHNNIGNALQRAGKLEEAVAAYESALRIQPNHAAAHANLGVLDKDRGRLEEAASHLRAAQALRPSGVLRVLEATLLPPVYTSLDELHAWRHRLVSNLQQMQRERLRFDLAREIVPNLFYLAYQGENDVAIQRDLARLYLAGSAPLSPHADGSGRADGKIQVGILSKYLRDHTIGTLMRGLFATLSRDKFAVTAIAGEDVRDAVTEFVRGHAERYVVLPDNLPASRRILSELKLDVLFYADIGMDPLTYTLAFSRFAPVQCVTWGHPVTSGIPTIDYFISSSLIEPADAAGHYTEQLMTLNTLPFYYYRPTIPSPLKEREAFGLAAGDHVYGCPQTLFKFHPEFDALLAEILRRDPRGTLVLIRGKHSHWEEKLRQRFSMTLADVLDRIRWLDPMPRAEFLNLLAVCDVLLDPIHFGGGNTSYEALALGVPLVTLPSPLMRGRITSALYRKMGMQDCVANSGQEYVDLAVALGTNPSLREAVRAKILATNSLLFEDLSAVRELEAFFERAVEALDRTPA